MKKLVFIAAWLCCSIFNYGFTLGYGTHRFPGQDMVGLAAFAALSGPFGVIPVVCIMPPMHWRVKPPTAEERWKAFHESNPSLSREWFEQHYN